MNNGKVVLKCVGKGLNRKKLLLFDPEIRVTEDFRINGISNDDYWEEIMNLETLVSPNFAAMPYYTWKHKLVRLHQISIDYGNKDA